jgi:NAD(P)-dependent dehydrogenase (short-subunit alcohol dehydrogenase family)
VNTSLKSAPDLSGKTLFITGASRGIGLAIAKRAAADGANIVILAKTTDPNPKLPGTIYSAAKEIEAAGGRALPLAVDIRTTMQCLRRWPKPWRLLAASTYWSTTPAPSV